MRLSVAPASVYASGPTSSSGNMPWREHLHVPLARADTVTQRAICVWRRGARTYRAHVRLGWSLSASVVSVWGCYAEAKEGRTATQS